MFLCEILAGCLALLPILCYLCGCRLLLQKPPRFQLVQFFFNYASHSDILHLGFNSTVFALTFPLLYDYSCWFPLATFVSACVVEDVRFLCSPAPPPAFDEEDLPVGTHGASAGTFALSSCAVCYAVYVVVLFLMGLRPDFVPLALVNLTWLQSISENLAKCDRFGAHQVGIITGVGSFGIYLATLRH